MVRPIRLAVLEIDDQVILRRLLDGEILGLRALEDLVDERGGAPVEVVKGFRSIRDQAAGLGVLWNAGDGGEAMLPGKLRDLDSPGEGVPGSSCTRSAVASVVTADRKAPSSSPTSRNSLLNLDAAGAAAFVEGFQCRAGAHRVVLIQEGYDARDSWKRLF